MSSEIESDLSDDVRAFAERIATDTDYVHPEVRVIDPEDHYERMRNAVERIADEESDVKSWEDVEQESALLASVNVYEHVIRFSVPNQDRWSEHDMVDALVHALNHEVMHDVLYQEEGREASVELDMLLKHVLDERDLLSDLRGDPKDRREEGA